MMRISGFAAGFIIQQSQYDRSQHDRSQHDRRQHDRLREE